MKFDAQLSIADEALGRAVATSKDANEIIRLLTGLHLKQDHTHVLLHAILDFVAVKDQSDPAKIEAIKTRLAASTDALQAAVSKATPEA